MNCLDMVKSLSQMKRIPLGCKSPLLKHVVCFRRQLYMILKCDLDELNLSFKLKLMGLIMLFLQRLIR